MNIAIVTPSIYMYQKLFKERIFAPGELVRHLVKGLIQKGHKVYWFTAPEQTKAEVIEGNQALLEKNLQIRTFQDIAPNVKEKISLYSSKMYYELDLLRQAYHFTQENKVDIVHVYHSTMYLAHYFEESVPIPTVYTLHDPVPTPDMLEYWLMQQFPKPRYISISDRQRGNMSDHFIDTVYHGIDTNEFAYSEQMGTEFISVGRLTPEKGFAQAIQAVKQAGETLQIATWLTDAAKSSEYYIKDIAPQVDNSSIRLSGLLLENERVTLYQKAKALLFPLQWEEPFGMVMIEAMATGTPVIAYNRGSVSEIVQDGVTGFIVDPDDTDRPNKGNWIIKKQGIDGLVEAIKRTREIKRSDVRKHVEDHFSLKTMVEGYERVYQKVIESR